MLKVVNALMSVVQLKEEVHGYKYFNDRQWKLGDLILATEDFTTHKKLRNIGDKSFEFLKEQVIESDEYKLIKQKLTGE